MSPRIVYVVSELAPLRTVVLAQSQFRAPDAGFIPDDQLAAELAILPDDEQAAMRAPAGHDLAEADPERRAWAAERTAFQALPGRSVTARPVTRGR